MEIGKKIIIHAYKFDGQVYRTWEFPIVLKETEEYICVTIQGTHVITASNKDRRFFHSKLTRPTIWYFFKNEWYNMIVSKKGNKFYYYINIASPFIYEEDIIKYIDFDLDYRVPDARGKLINLLDLNEFHEHSIKYKYPGKLVAKIKEVQSDILAKFNNGKFQHFLDFKLIYHYDNLKENGDNDVKVK